MTLTALLKSSAAAVAAAVPTTRRPPNKILHFFFSFGLFGLFFVSIVDSSFVPLPIPGTTDIMIILFAAQKMNVIALVLVATAGSALGGFFSHQVGQSGGMSFLEHHVPPRIFKRVTTWMESHAILAVALPAILPPPMPLSPFVLAAGALHMSRKTFMTTFTISRFLRHSLAAFLGVHYGRSIVRLWNQFSAKWAEPILIVVWSIILVSVAYALWKLYRTSQNVRRTSNPTYAPQP